MTRPRSQGSAGLRRRSRVVAVQQFVNDCGGVVAFERLVAASFTEAEAEAAGASPSTEGWVARLLAKDLLAEMSAPETSEGSFEILADHNRRPEVSLSGAATEPGERFHLSLSHDGGLAAALLVCEIR